MHKPASHCSRTVRYRISVSCFSFAVLIEGAQNPRIAVHGCSLVQAIEALPLMQTPEVFGLHGNADIQYYSNATKDLWKNLIELQPRAAGSGGGMTRDEFIKQTAQDILNAIPDPFDLHVIKKEIGVPSPTEVVLLQELERWNQCATFAYCCPERMWVTAELLNSMRPSACRLYRELRSGGLMQGGCCHACVAEGRPACVGR